MLAVSLGVHTLGVAHGLAWRAYELTGAISAHLPVQTGHATLAAMVPALGGINTPTIFATLNLPLRAKGHAPPLYALGLLATILLWADDAAPATVLWIAGRVDAGVRTEQLGGGAFICGTRVTA